MGKKDPRVDAYIAKSADFARPLLKHICAMVPAGCPEVEETIKWSHPSFIHHGILCGMAAFKEHCVFGFGNEAMRKELVDDDKEKAMGQFGRVTSMSDLPKAQLFKRLVSKAARLNESGVKVPRPKRKPPAKLVVPPDLTAALKKNKKAQATYDRFSYSNKKEYVEWITEAKREETRAKRLATTLEWLTEGKTRNWKYEKC